ncbi:MAG: hypothetical protein M1823_000245 [Watsoniomyces obsoletus]|nr:MAG: hypothetical protein M1823_000245 [Watsoniomyces obsoletus]
MALRNPYQNGVDFESLAKDSPEFAQVLKKNGQLDFSDPKAVQQLTMSLLNRDFNLKIILPDDRLCPPVPNRLNYILWLQDLLDTTSEEYRDNFDPNREVLGLDIGTGASCIYPLLGCSQRPKWRFLGTDIDDKNLQIAQQNISSNQLQSRIKLIKRRPLDPLIPKELIESQDVDFVMCNPPFYDSREEMLSLAEKKHRPPFSACTGAEIEMITPGGEIGFIQRLIDESVVLKEEVQWYTTMLGKFGSVTSIIERLKSAGIQNWAVTEFIQGTKTRRWAVAWSWRDLRPRMDIARGVPKLPKHLLPLQTERRLDFTGKSKSIDEINRRVNDILTSLPALWQWKSSMSTGIGFVMGDVWSRAYRRKQKALEIRGGDQQQPNKDAEDEDEEEIDHENATLGFKIQTRLELKGTSGVNVSIRWLKGVDPVLFESFCGMLKRKLQEDEEEEDGDGDHVMS